MNAKTETKKIIIFLPALAACLPFASTDGTRAYLKSVYVHWRDGATACVSTDGHRLCLAQSSPDGIDAVKETLAVEPGDHEGIILTSADAKEIARWDVKKSVITAQHFATLEIKDNGKVVAKSWNGKFTRECEAIDATYPDYQRTIPQDDRPLIGEPTGFNAVFLASILTVARAGFSHKKSLSVTAHLHGSSNPAKFTMRNPDGDRATIVIMPMRV
ncbi:hypothetical protein ACCS68_14575 [Rhizobium beringeri]|uniref:hypothetical protein n=1 Tax=Rhizobium beringeri TaxID=3019934 RepID=UPI003CF04F27